MKKHLLKSMLLTVLAMLCTVSTWAAGYTRTLNENLEVSGYNVKQFYNFQTNTPEVLPTTGDLRYREGGIWGLHNYGSGPRSATITIPVAEGDILVIQHYSNDNISTINRGSLNSSLTAMTGYQVYDITTSADDFNVTIARYGGLVAALVMEKDAAAQMADFTINYVYNGDAVKTLSGEVAVGSSVVTDASFYVENTKYIRVDGEAESFEIAADNNDFTVNVRLAENFTWTAKSNVGDYFISGTAWEGEYAYAKYPLYQLVDGKLWTKAATSSTYAQPFEVTEDNQEFELTYTETDIDNVVFYAEVEEIEGMGVNASGNPEARSSNRAVGYSIDGKTTFATLPQGKYKIVASFYTQNSVGGNFSFYADKRCIWNNIIGGSNNATYGEKEVVLAQESNQLFLGQCSATQAVDYIYIQKLDDPTEKELAAAAEADAKADRVYNIAGNKFGATMAQSLAEGEEDIYTASATAVRGKAGKSFEYTVTLQNGSQTIKATWAPEEDGLYTLTFTADVAGEGSLEINAVRTGDLPALKGDVNGDDEVDISDVTALVNMILGKAEKNAAADVNGDGESDISDVTALVNIILGK